MRKVLLEWVTPRLTVAWLRSSQRPAAVAQAHTKTPEQRAVRRTVLFQSAHQGGVQRQ